MRETIFSPDSELFRPRFFTSALADLRHSPAVGWQLFRRGLQARHRRSWLGYLWLLLPTLATTLVWMYVHSHQIVRVKDTGIPYPIYVLSGTILWQVFTDAINAPLQQLTAGRQMLTRSRIPHEAMILSGVLEVLLNCGIRMLILGGAILAGGIYLRPAMLLAPLAIAAIITLGLAIGLTIAPAGLLYDDVGRGIGLATAFWVFLTPVFYPTPSSGVFRLNPVTPLLETARAWLTTGNSARGFAVVTLAAASTLVLAWLFNRLARPHVVARLG